jgi:outer membrane protein TolC
MRKLLPLLLLPACLFGRTLTLNEARTLAVANDPSLQAAQASTNAAEQQRKAALGKFLPTVTFEGGYRYDQELIHYDTGVEFLPIYDFSAGYPQVVPTQKAAFQIDQDLGQHTNAEWTLKAVQPLFTGGKIWRNAQIQGNLKQVAMYQEDLKRQEILVGLDESYWRVAELFAKARLAKQYQNNVQAHLDDLNNYLEAGLVTNNDVLKAKVKLSEADLALLQARDGLALAKMDLNRRLGVTDEIELADSLGEDPVPLDVSPDASSRPELKALQKVCSIRKDLTGVQAASFLPDVALQAGYKLTRPNPYNSFDDEYGDNWQVYLMCQWKLFDSTSREHEYSAARQEERVAQLNYEDAQKQIDLQIRQERFRYDEAEHRVELTRTNVRQADDNLRETTDRFHEGIVKSSDLLDAQTLWQQARANLIEALAARNVQTTRYLKACGRL